MHVSDELQSSPTSPEHRHKVLKPCWYIKSDVTMPFWSSSRREESHVDGEGRQVSAALHGKRGWRSGKIYAQNWVGENVKGCPLIISRKMPAVWGTGRGNMYLEVVSTHRHLNRENPKIGLCLEKGHSVGKNTEKVLNSDQAKKYAYEGRQMLDTCRGTLSELWRIRRRWSLSLSSGSLTRRTNDRLYSRRLADLWSAEEARLVCSRARYRSPRESACILQSLEGPVNEQTTVKLNSQFLSVE